MSFQTKILPKIVFYILLLVSMQMHRATQMYINHDDNDDNDNDDDDMHIRCRYRYYLFRITSQNLLIEF